MLGRAIIEYDGAVQRAENWLEFYNGLYRQYQEKGESDSYIWKFFLRRTGEVAGKESALYFYNSEHYSMAEKSLYCGFLLEGWVTSDLDGAFEWLETEIDPEFRDPIWGYALRSVAQTDPATAAGLLGQVPIEYQAKYTKKFISHFIKTEGFDKAEELFQYILNQASSGGYLNEKHITDMFRDLAYDKVFTLLESEDGNKKSAKWLAGHIGSPYVRCAGS